MLRGIGKSPRLRARTVTANDKKSLHDYHDLNDPDDGKFKWSAESGVVSHESSRSVDRDPDKDIEKENQDRRRPFLPCHPRHSRQAALAENFLIVAEIAIFSLFIQ